MQHCSTQSQIWTPDSLPLGLVSPHSLHLSCPMQGTSWEGRLDFCYTLRTRLLSNLDKNLKKRGIRAL
jgi:hypothetical protein